VSVRAELPPLLLPRPRRLALTGGRLALERQCAAERISPLADLAIPGDEAYRLRVTHAVQAPVLIEARTEAGLRHARSTLAQLARQYGESLPCMVVEDGPAIARRGFMLDISRDRVPTMKHLLEVVDLLASLKYNHLQLYTEHTFAYAGHEEAWQHASPMTPTEVRELDTYCSQRGIELAANQNCFGHLSSWLRLPRYAPLAETHGEWHFEFEGANGSVQRVHRSGPFSLCPVDPASLSLVEDLLGKLLPCFTSPLVNIGCDETFDVGFGRSADAVVANCGGEDLAVGRARVYLEFVAAVAAIARRHGKTGMFWADIALRRPELLTELPEEMVRLAWGYEADSDWAQWLSVLGAAHTWVCPGTSSWRSITGRTTERRANIAGAAQAATRHGAPGLLLTDWGDGGHRQPWVISLPGIAQAAEAAWSGHEQPDLRAVSLHVLGDESLRAAKWLDALGDVDRPLRLRSGRREPGDSERPLRNASALYVDLHTPLRTSEADDAALRLGVLSTPELEWGGVMERLRALDGTLPGGLPDLLARECRHALRVALVAAERGAARRRRDGVDSAIARRLAGCLRGIIDEHRQLWNERSREGGLVSSCSHYERVIDDLLAEDAS
jgi:hexosaminidase